MIQCPLFYVLSPLALGPQQPEEVSLFNLFCRERTFCSACFFSSVLGKEFVEIVIWIHGQSEELLCGFRFLFGFLGGLTRLFGHFLGLLSQSGSLHHSCFSLDTNLSRLARCAGLSSVGMCRQITSTHSLVFRNWIASNCLWSSSPNIQCKATLLSEPTV